MHDINGRAGPVNVPTPGKQAGIFGLLLSLLAPADLTVWHLLCTFPHTPVQAFTSNLEYLLSPAVGKLITYAIISIFLYFLFAVLGIVLSSLSRARGYRNKVSMAGRLIGIGDLMLAAYLFILWLV